MVYDHEIPYSATAGSPYFLTEGALTLAGDATAAIAHGFRSGDYLIVFCNKAFNLRFGLSGMAAPNDLELFPAGIHRFRVRDSATHFILRTNAATAKYAYGRGTP